MKVTQPQPQPQPQPELNSYEVDLFRALQENQQFMDFEVKTEDTRDTEDVAAMLLSLSRPVKITRQVVQQEKARRQERRKNETGDSGQLISLVESSSDEE